MESFESVDMAPRSVGPTADNDRQTPTAAPDNAIYKQSQVTQASNSHLDVPAIDNVPHVGV
jgi:hypothetical protein